MSHINRFWTKTKHAESHLQPTNSSKFRAVIQSEISKLSGAVSEQKISKITNQINVRINALINKDIEIKKEIEARLDQLKNETKEEIRVLSHEIDESKEKDSSLEVQIANVREDLEDLENKLDIEENGKIAKLQEMKDQIDQLTSSFPIGLNAGVSGLLRIIIVKNVFFLSGYVGFSETIRDPVICNLPENSPLTSFYGFVQAKRNATFRAVAISIENRTVTAKGDFKAEELIYFNEFIGIKL